MLLGRCSYELNYTWFKMRGKCCSRSRRRHVHVNPLKKVRLRAQKWSSDLLKVCFLMWKMVFWNKYGESYRCSCWLIQQWSSRVEMVEDYWYQEGWLVPQVQPSIHAEQGRGGKDTSPSPPIAAINPPPSRTHGQIKPCAQRKWEMVFQDK